MIQCSSCGKQIDKVPEWLQSAKVEFVCNNCPNRTAKNIAFVTLDAEPKAASPAIDEDIDLDEEELPDE
ncbi:MAG TPA: hypothetical protein VG944_05180 [Fimbriimonas sp.]|nr:hypothetical protein [Fimbriimonas sp.]